MTTTYEKKIRCALCRKKSKQTFVASTSAFGAPDLDTRPPRLKRYTINTWVQRCPKCGYCNSDLSVERPRARRVMERPVYARQIGESSCCPLAASFLCQAIIEENADNLRGAAWALIHAAWACDDTEQPEAARNCRQKAVGMVDRFEAAGEVLAEPDGATTAILADLLRRSGEFKKAREILEERIGDIDDDFVRRLLFFQHALALEFDSDPHTTEEVPEDWEHEPYTEGSPR